MATKPIDELVGLLGFEYDEKGLDQFKEGMKSAGDLMKKAIIGIGAIGAAAFGAVTGLNAMTVAQEKSAAAVRFSSSEYRAWTDLVQDAGFEADTFTDLAEEMNNKIGESKKLFKETGKPLGAVEDAFKILGVDFKTMLVLSPEDQFKKIARAITELDDAQQAVSAADILMGGEANKFFSLLRQRGQSVDEAISQQKDMNLLTEGSIEAAFRWQRGMAGITRALAQAGQEMAGFFADQFGGIEKLREKFIGYFKANKEAIKNFIVVAINLFKTFFDILVDVGGKLSALVGIVGGASNAIKILTIIMGGLIGVKIVRFIIGISAALKGMTFSALAAGKAVKIAMRSFLLFAAIEAAIILVTLLVKHWDKVKDAFATGWDFFKGKFFEDIEIIKQGFFGFINFFLKGINTVFGAINKVSSFIGKEFQIPEIKLLGSVDATARQISPQTVRAPGGGAVSNTSNSSLDQKNTIYINTNNPGAAGQAVDQTLRRWSDNTVTNLAGATS